MAWAFKHRSRLIVLLFLWFGFSLRLLHLGVQSLWYDETVSAVVAAKNVVGLVAHTALDIHPPGYYVLLHYWMDLAGRGEYSLAFFSLIFGVLLIALVFPIARLWLSRRGARWASAVVAFSPFHVWYSQEVRMYTLGAVLGLLTLWFALRVLRLWTDGGESTVAGRWRSWRWEVGYVVAAALGLYVLYYFAFWLVFLVALPAAILAFMGRWRRLSQWAGLHLAILVLYLPWLPVAWRQVVSPPVPSWRQPMPWLRAVIEAWSALCLGQSVRPEQVWSLLLLAAALFVAGGWYLRELELGGTGRLCRFATPPAWLLLPCLTMGPLVLMLALSPVAPLYHVRYVFIYSAPFAVVVGAGLAWLETKSRLTMGMASVCLIGGSALSLYQMVWLPEYAADDLRGAVHFLADQWRPGDAVLVNAGYAYTALEYYYPGRFSGPVRLTEEWTDAGDKPLLVQTGIIDGGPNLGWGRPDADFYSLTAEEARPGLARLDEQYARLWVFRAYDTVADGKGVVRSWLKANLLCFEDRTFAGESYVHVTGFLSSHQSPPPAMEPIAMDGGITVLGWAAPNVGRIGNPVDVAVWMMAERDSVAAHKPGAVSLKLWEVPASGENPNLIAQQDAWPIGSRLLTPDWPPGTMVRFPMRLALPENMAVGRYWLDLELYDPDTLVPWARKDGSGRSIPLASLLVED